MTGIFLGKIRAFAAAALLCALGAGPISAQSAPDLRALGDALQMDTTLAIMQQEAVANAMDIAPALLGAGDHSAWRSTITQIFDPKSARDLFDAGLGTSTLSAQDVAQVIAFFQSPLGAQILTLENQARSQLLDQATEAAAQENWQALQNSPLPAQAVRVQALRDIVRLNDLLSANVAAALNGNLAFYEGLSQAGALAGMTPADMLADVMAQEEQLRADTEDWLFPFLALAYAPLSADDLQAYLAFTQTPAAKALNSALFAAFDAMGSAQSRAMGLAAGQLMAGQDI
jgi:hypothetical protein